MKGKTLNSRFITKFFLNVQLLSSFSPEPVFVGYIVVWLLTNGHAFELLVTSIIDSGEAAIANLNLFEKSR